ncbi:ABC transporter substrate-binding protein [Hymenobacter metallilatus]|uniref:Thiamine pyrimidine synthase n=1 Tax=Hymenobacter metallilatus TaxID=2493666 RepID=A0A3R9NDQ0_9BACT|nr:ABC transporter substrate-binding protein [Hymenobacter metallilatus]RSK29544.1 ABC transporter substrate-binding protein [Hymenobacter metallilatus]
MSDIKIALDWTINTNHTGFVVAQQLGWYTQHGLKVELLTPEADNYAVTPAKKVELGQADFALCPLESIISYRTKHQPFDAIAVAALLTEDLSSIVTLMRPDIQSPKDLAGKIYASYQARYEDRIVEKMLENDGAAGRLTITYPEKLGIWNTLLQQQADATWIFDNWEGVQARQQGLALTRFRLADYGIPYGYSPVIMASQKRMLAHADTYRKFLRVSGQGFMYAKDNPEEAAALLQKVVPAADRNAAFLLESQKVTAGYYGSAASWGHMSPAKVQRYLDWLAETGLESRKLPLSDVMTNSLL